MRITQLALAAFLASASSNPAAAATYLFQITGSNSATFQIPSSPNPNQNFGTSFSVTNVTGSFQGVAVGKDIFFYVASIGCGLGIKNTNNAIFNLVTDGPQLFTGTVSAPTFLTGTFDLTQFNGSGRYTLMIKGPNDAIPEPATWGLLISGFYLAGTRLRRRRFETSWA